MKGRVFSFIFSGLKFILKWQNYEGVTIVTSRDSWNFKHEVTQMPFQVFPNLKWTLKEKY